MMSSLPKTFVASPHILGRASTPHNLSNGSVSTGSASSQSLAEGLENAGRLIDHNLKEDASFVDLSGQLRIATHSEALVFLLVTGLKNT